MLSDSSLTNILVVSGVSQIRYRVYSQHCSRSTFFNYLKHNAPEHDSRLELTLMKAYNDLISTSIPALWRIASESNESDKDLELELWVFWFDERHTGKIDANDDLGALDEVKVGSFTWENAYSKIQSPTASPVASSTQSNSSIPVTVSEEYKWFIKSIRNLIHRQMIYKGALPLGEFYIYPNSDQDVLGDSSRSTSSPSSLSKNNSSLLCCSYNIYLASTNLIFQPNTRRMRIRPITQQIIRTRGKKVIISPSGETMLIASNKNYSLSQQIEENILNKWSLLLDIPYTNLIIQNQKLSPSQRQQPRQASLPNLVAIKASNEKTFYYPTCLIFVSSSSKVSPTAMAGMNGLFGFNQGFSEDLGDKWHRWAWNSRVSNYWEYTCPRESTITAVLDTLSQDSGNTNNGLLQKAISEPVIASPLMAAKSVATPGSATAGQRNETTSTPSSTLNEDDVDPHQPLYQQSTIQRNSKSRYQSGLSLVDFAMAHFAIPHSTDDLVEYPLLANSTPAIIQDTPQIQSQSQPQPQPQQQQPQQPQPQPQQQQPFLAQQNLQIHPQQPQILVNNHTGANLLPIAAGEPTTAINSTYQSPQIPNLELDAFGMVESMDVDSMVLDMPNRWTEDGMDDLDNFELGVTEADFDFFESSGPAPAPPVVSAPVDNYNDLNDLMLTEEQTPFEPNQFTEEKMLINLDQKQQQNILDMDLDHSTAPDDLSVTPLEIGMAQHDPFNFDEQMQEQQQIKVDPHQQLKQEEYLPQEQQLFVPPQFAPVKLESMVNDSKYINGGKFTYIPDINHGDHGLLKRDRARKNMDYRPDYVPVVPISKSKKRRKSSKLLLLDTISKDNKPLLLLSEDPTSTSAIDSNDKLIPVDITMSTGAKNHSSSDEDDDDNDSSSSSSSSSDDASSIGQEDEDLCYSDQDAQSQDAYDSEDGASKSNRTIKTMLEAQDIFIKQLTSLEPLSDPKKKPLKLDQVIMDYDSPFSRTVASSVIRVSNARIESNKQEEAEALDYLCQQAVMGGYPFSGGIEAISSNGFEANEGESAKVLTARRRILLQKFNGDTVHIPSTPNDIDFMTLNFKNVLGNIFHQQKSRNNADSIDSMCIDSMPLPASVTVKGPLNVQQYYDLSETNQAHSKYGKYQVKKRRPAEPNLDVLLPPSITVSRQEEFIEGTSKLIMFWEKLRLEPYSNKKHINYFVMYPKNESIENSVSHFFKGLSTLYETCHLGVHHPGNAGPYRKGLVPVPLLPASEGESFAETQLRSYAAECQTLGSIIGGSTPENLHIVIYMVNPISHLASHLDLSRCFSKLMNASDAVATNQSTRNTEKNKARLVLQLMPIEHILRATAFGGCLKFGLKEIAFSVYSKCHSVITRQRRPISDAEENAKLITELYAPPFVLSKPIPAQIQFKLKKAISAFPTILESHAVLHMGYTFSFDKRWMIIVWTDNRGELVEFALLDNQHHRLPLAAVFAEAWSRTKQISKRTGFAWTFVIAKLGLLFEQELKAWISCIPTDEKVAIVSLDIESTLYVNTNSGLDVMNDIMSVNTDSLNTTSAPSMMSSPAASAAYKKVSSEVIDSGQTKALLLNHRVAYSNKRERMSFGILGMESISEVEDWMIPLASGYMIHTPPTTENPNNELFNCTPFALEIHLVYNQTSHSAYSTLRDVIKKYHALSFVNVMPSNSNCFPIHLSLAERLSRILLVVNT